jgi:hypothetical protein
VQNSSAGLFFFNNPATDFFIFKQQAEKSISLPSRLFSLPTFETRNAWQAEMNKLKFQSRKCYGILVFLSSDLVNPSPKQAGLLDTFKQL